MRRTWQWRAGVLVAVAFAIGGCDRETVTDSSAPGVSTDPSTSTMGTTVPGSEPTDGTEPPITPPAAAPESTLLPPPTGVTELVDLGDVGGFPLIERPEWYCGVDGGTHAAMIDPAPGSLEWEIEVPYMGDHEPIVGEHTAWFVGAQQCGRQIAALDLATGRPRWLMAAGDHVMGVGVVGDTLVVATLSAVDGFDAVNGEHVWRHPTTRGRAPFATSPTRGEFGIRVPSSGSMAYINDDGMVTALDTADGSVRWTFETIGDFSYSPVLVGDTVFHVAFEGRLYALDAVSGEERWSWSSPPGVGITDELVVTADTVTVLTTGLHPDPPADGEQIYALSIADGAQRWQRAVSDFDSFTRVVSDSQLLTTPQSGDTFSSIDIDTGAVEWTADSPASSATWPPPPRSPISP